MIDEKLENTEIQRFNEALKISFLPKKIYEKRDMAAFLGVSFGHFSSICNGKVKVSEQFRKRITEELGINWGYVLTGDGEILLSPGGATAQTKKVNAPGGVVQNIANNGNGHVEANANTNPASEPTFSEVLQQLVATNAKLVETNAKLVEMLNK